MSLVELTQEQAQPCLGPGPFQSAVIPAITSQFWWRHLVSVDGTTPESGLDSAFPRY